LSYLILWSPIRDKAWRTFLCRRNEISFDTATNIDYHNSDLMLMRSFLSHRVAWWQFLVTKRIVGRSFDRSKNIRVSQVRLIRGTNLSRMYMCTLHVWVCICMCMSVMSVLMSVVGSTRVCKSLFAELNATYFIQALSLNHRNNNTKMTNYKNNTLSFSFLRALIRWFGSISVGWITII